jgi:YesN/AraC family two-component response regulator
LFCNRGFRGQSLLAALSVERIEPLVGYEDPAYFSRLLARRTGLAPTLFRLGHRRT